MLNEKKGVNMKSVRLFDLNMGQMPDTLPLLPLMEMVLMPEGKFSIRLTDYKQIAMIYWALANGRMVAIVQQKTDKTLYLKGCAARICGFSENDDDSLMVHVSVTFKVPHARAVGVVGF